METTLRNKNSSKICVSNCMPIGTPGVVLWRFSRYFWNTPRMFTLRLNTAKKTDNIKKFFQWKSRKIQFCTKNSVNIYLYVSQEWGRGYKDLTLWCDEMFYFKTNKTSYFDCFIFICFSTTFTINFYSPTKVQNMMFKWIYIFRSQLPHRIISHWGLWNYVKVFPLFRYIIIFQKRLIYGAPSSILVKHKSTSPLTFS